MNVFPMATLQSFFSDVVTYRFRLRPLLRSNGSMTQGTAEYTIDATFDDVPEVPSIQTGKIVTSNGRDASFVVGEAGEQNGMRFFAGLVSGDPFFMDVEAAIRTDLSGKALVGLYRQRLQRAADLRVPDTRRDRCFLSAEASQRSR